MGVHKTGTLSGLNQRLLSVASHTASVVESSIAEGSDHIDDLEAWAHQCEVTIKETFKAREEIERRYVEIASKSDDPTARLELSRLENAFRETRCRTWSVEHICRFLALPGTLPSEFFECLACRVEANFSDAEDAVRNHRFMHSRKFQSKLFKMRVLSTSKGPSGTLAPTTSSYIASGFMHSTLSRQGSNTTMSDKDVWSVLAPEQVSATQRLIGGGIIEVGFFWTGASQLFGGSFKDEAEGAPNILMRASNQLMVVRAISNSDESVLNTVVGRAVVKRAWTTTARNYWVLRFLDAVSLLLFFAITQNFRNPDLTTQRKDASNSVYLFFLALYSTYTVLAKGLEVVECVSVFTWQKTLSIFLSFWNAFLLITEIFNVVIVLQCLYVSSAADFLGRHPVFFSISIFFRWSYFAVTIMGTDVVGQTVLPAFEVVTGMESMMFLAYLAFAIFGLSNAYWVLPIDDNTAFFAAFLKMYRLGVLSDFDINDLEGDDQEIHVEDGLKRLEDPDPAAQGSVLWHNGVRYLFIVFSVIVSTMMMNVYIGLLSAEYERVKLSSRAVLARFQARLCIPMLLRMRFYRRVALFFCPHRMHQVPTDKGGFWITFPKDDFPGLWDADDCELRRSRATSPTIEETTQMQELVAQVKSLQEQVQSMQERLDQNEGTGELVANVVSLQEQVQSLERRDAQQARASEEPLPLPPTTTFVEQSTMMLVSPPTSICAAAPMQPAGVAAPAAAASDATLTAVAAADATTVEEELSAAATSSSERQLSLSHPEVLQELRSLIRFVRDEMDEDRQRARAAPSASQPPQVFHIGDDSTALQPLPRGRSGSRSSSKEAPRRPSKSPAPATSDASLRLARRCSAPPAQRDIGSPAASDARPMQPRSSSKSSWTSFATAGEDENAVVASPAVTDDAVSIATEGSEHAQTGMLSAATPTTDPAAEALAAEEDDVGGRVPGEPAARAAAAERDIPAEA